MNKYRYILATILCLSVMKVQANQSPNILFVTVDDMNWDSVGVYGCALPEITPNIDSIAAAGMRFQRAYVQASNCSPSRNAFQTGRYPHSSGMRGFFYVDANFKTLPEILKSNGYITGVLNKPADTSLTSDFDRYWDHWVILKGAEKRGAEVYTKALGDFLDATREKNQPFYCVVNIADPHKPFYYDEKSKKAGYDKYGPTRIYKKTEIEVPPFLPEAQGIRQELTNYYNSVKRADDCVGAVLQTLDASEFKDNTVVIFISDHGMPLPYAKSSVYQNGVRTPWIIRWPEKIKERSVDNDNLISAIDFMPSVLDIAGISKPKGLQGQSFIPLLNDKKQKGRDYVYVEFNENAGGLPRPTRGVHSKKYSYAFNPWATGKYPFKSAASSHKSYQVIRKLSATDPAIKKRFEHLVHRCEEELYDLEKDPHALNNLIHNPEYASVVKDMRKHAEKFMIETNDYILPAFESRGNTDKLNRFMANEEKEALERSKTLQWKRFKNQAGGTGKNTGLYKVKQ